MSAETVERTADAGAASASTPITAEPEITHIILRILLPDVKLVLHIPLEVISRLTLYPLAWLCYIGFAITAAKGALKRYHHYDQDDDDEDEEQEEGEREMEVVHEEDLRSMSPDDLTTEMAYVYVMYKDYDIDHIAAPSLVDRSHRGSSTSNTSCGPDFKSEVLERDGDIPLYPNERFGNDPEACRIVPFSKIDLNLEHITARCASGCLGFTNGEPEALAHLIENGLDHPQNGVSLEVGLHRLLDDRGLVILRTPNPYLLPTDIPHLGDAPREQGQSYQTFQWFVYKNITSRDKFPDNFDARFAPGIPKELLPNIHLLDYVYGASALKHWATSNTRNILQILAQKHRSAYSHEEARKHTPKTLKRGRSTTLSPAIGETDYKNKSKARKSKIGMSTQDAFAIMNLLYNPAVLASSRACQEEAERMEKEAKDDRVKSWLATTPSP